MDLLRRSVQVLEQLREVNGRVSFGPPKTDASRRTVAIGAGLATELGTHLGTYCDRDPGALLFTTATGKPVRPSRFRSGPWKRATEATALAPLTPHVLRHTAAALAVAAGAHPKALQARLGHGSIGVTLGTYGHLYDGADAQVAADVERALARALESTPGGALGT